MEQERADAAVVGRTVPAPQDLRGASRSLAAEPLGCLCQVIHVVVGQLDPCRELHRLEIGKADPARLRQQPDAAHGAGRVCGLGCDLRRPVGGVQHHRVRAGPGRVVAVLHPAARRIDHLGQLRVGHHRGRPDQRGVVARHHAAPEALVGGLTQRQRGVVQVHDVPVAVAVHGVEQRELLHGHGGVELIQVARQAHAPELLQHARPGGAGHAQRHGLAILLRHHGAVRGAADGQRLGVHRAVLAEHLEHLALDGERLRAAVQLVAAAGRRQPVEGGQVGRVGGLGPAEVLGEALAQDREPDPDGAVRGDSGRRELRLEVGVPVAPVQVRVAQQHDVAGRGLGRTDRPAVRFARCRVRLAQPGRHPLAARMPLEVDDAHRVGEHVRHGERQDAAGGRAESVALRGCRCIQPGDESAQQRRELRALLRGPARGALRDAVGPYPTVIVEPSGAVALGSASSPLRVKACQQLAVRLHLRVAVGVEQPAMIGRLDVRDPVAVPEYVRFAHSIFTSPRSSSQSYRARFDSQSRSSMQVPRMTTP